MSGTTITGTTTIGVSLTDATDNPVTIALDANVEDNDAAALYGVATTAWSITNFGAVLATGSSASSVGILLAGGGTITNQQSASIGGYASGISLASAGSVANSGTISASATAAHIGVGIGVKMPGGTVTNTSGGNISGNYVGVLLTGQSSVDNAGLIQGASVGNSYAIGIVGTGSVTNEMTGTLTSGSVGVELTGGGSVTNLGSIASTLANAQGQLRGYDGVALLSGGTVTNMAGARITSQWIGVQIGQTVGSVTGVIDNQGFIYASNGVDAGAAIWLHGTGLVSNASTGTIAGGPFGVVTYYDTTIVNRGVISGTEFAVSQANTAASNLIEVAPGASFVGTVAGGADIASAATGTLELLAGGGEGVIDGFGTQYVGFGEILLDANAAWSLAGTVTATQTVDFSGAGQLTLADPLAMAGTIDGFVTGDRIVLSGVTGVNSAVTNVVDQLVVSTASGPVVTLQLDPSRHDPTGTAFEFSQSGGNTVLIACFAEGTRIATEHGDVAVEALEAGMRVRSPFGGTTPIVWMGHRRTDCRRHPRPHDVWPVRVEAGAFGSGLPARALWLSPDHAVFWRGVLIPVRYLVNGRSIAQVQVDEITYWHVELPRHDVLLAEGLACESYLDTGNRVAFANGGAATMLHPDFALQVWHEHACAELVRKGARLEAARDLLLRHAVALGHECSDDPCIAVLADGRRMQLRSAGRRFSALGVGGRVRLRSRAWVPAHMRADASDHRSLGIAVADLRFAGAPIRLDDPVLSAGWHAPEDGWRWTDGDASLDLPGRGTLEFSLALGGTYWCEAPPSIKERPARWRRPSKCSRP